MFDSCRAHGSTNWRFGPAGGCRLVKPEDLVECRRSSVRHSLLEELGHGVLPACGDILLCEVPLGGGEVVRLEVAEHLVAVAEDRVVPDPRTAEGVEHLRPDIPMSADVLSDLLR